MAWLEAGAHINAVANLPEHSSVTVTGYLDGGTSDGTARAAVDSLGQALCAVELIWVNGLGQTRKGHLSIPRKVPLTCLGLTGTAGATASYLGGRFGSRHSVPRHEKTRSASPASFFHCRADRI
ncbi:hypothetical protein [Mycolicibacterium sp. 624]|uniref:hypothetical protein n=1 Tax=Mycolicibacterium sp. 624 TaxID=3156314 RepID=UPI003397488D